MESVTWCIKHTVFGYRAGILPKKTKNVHLKDYLVKNTTAVNVPKSARELDRVAEQAPLHL